MAIKLLLMKNKKIAIIAAVSIFVVVLLAAYFLSNGGEQLGASITNLNNLKINTKNQTLSNKPMQGIIHYVEIDNADGTDSSKLIFNTDDGKFIPLIIPVKNVNAALLEKHIQIGDLKNASTISEISALPNRILKSKFDHKVLVITVYTAGQTPPNHILDTQIEQRMQEAGVVFGKNSDGVTKTQFDFYHTELAYPGPSYYQYNDASFLADSNIDLSKYTDYYVVNEEEGHDLTTPTNCHGMSSIGPNQYITSKGTFTFGLSEVDIACFLSQNGVPTHELGHAFGLQHANLFVNGTTITAPPGYIGGSDITQDGDSRCKGLDITDPKVLALGYACLWNYGDDTFMASANYTNWAHFLLSPTAREKLGAPIHQQLVDHTGVYTIYADNYKTDQTKEIIIPGGPNGSYSLEYRNIDKPEIVIRFLPSDAFRHAIDPNTVTAGDTYRLVNSYDYSLEYHQYFTDQYKKITVNFVGPVNERPSASIIKPAIPESASVNISFGS